MCFLLCASPHCTVASIVRPPADSTTHSRALPLARRKALGLTSVGSGAIPVPEGRDAADEQGLDVWPVKGPVREHHHVGVGQARREAKAPPHRLPRLWSELLDARPTG